jgi:surface protein
MFSDATIFNADISTWVTDSVTNMSYMFNDATIFNSDISTWVTDNVTDMSYMFNNANAFNADISSWVTDNVTNMSHMFSDATIFNADISSWVTDNVTDMSYMFQGTNDFNQSLSTWDVSKVTNMSHMFENTVDYNNNSLALSWTNTRTALTVDMSYMFNNADSFNAGISNWNTSNVTNMSYMFQSAISFNQNLSSWNIGNVTNMTNMFSDSNLVNSSGLLTDNFDNILNGWALQTVQQNVILNGTSRSSYSQSSYDTLANNNWTIDATLVTYDLTNFNRTFTYRNVDKTPVLGVTYKLLYGNTVLSTYTRILSLNQNSTSDSYVFENIRINNTGLVTFTIEEDNVNNTVIDSIYVTINGVCFKEGSKILCLKDNIEKYIPIEDLRKGDLVKTRLNGYVPIHMIGKSPMYHKKTDKRRKEQLYRCSKEKFEEVFEDLIITGCHSILVDNFTSEKQREKAIETNNNRIFITDKKYRLPACVDERTSVYEKDGLYTIYHLALENDDYYMNYGIYANGLLVETCSKRYLTELSGMEIIE